MTSPTPENRRYGTETSPTVAVKPKRDRSMLHLCTGCCTHRSLCGGTGSRRGGLVDEREALRLVDCVVCAEMTQLDNCPHCGASLWEDHDG